MYKLLVTLVVLFPTLSSSSSHCPSESRQHVHEEMGNNNHDHNDYHSSAAKQSVLDLVMQTETPSTPLLHIKQGTFIMGTDKPIIPEDGESPARMVQTSAFQLQAREVSIRQFAYFVAKTNFVTETEKFGWSFAFEKTLSPKVLAEIDKKVESVPWWLPVQGAFWYQPEGKGSVITADRLDYPVVHVTWNDAKAYCEWLGLRLPREAEFERALRGDAINASFPWGNVLTPQGKFRANLWQGKFPDVNTIEDGYEYAAPVDAFGPQNEFGVENLLGNVWEWVADAWTVNHGKYITPGVTLVDPQVEVQGRVNDPTLDRVKRGGSYMCHESYCYRYRTASRSHNSADSSAQNLGIRCAGDDGTTFDQTTTM